MNKESFLDTLRQQYTDEIREAFLECEHDAGRKIDVPELNRRLKRLMKAAKLEGLAFAEFDELARAALPSLAEKIDLGLSAPTKVAA